MQEMSRFTRFGSQKKTVNLGLRAKKTEFPALPPAADLRPTKGFTDWVTLFRGCLLIALLMLALVLAGLVVEEVPAAWAVPLLVVVLVEVVTAGI